MATYIATTSSSAPATMDASGNIVTPGTITATTLNAATVNTNSAQTPVSLSQNGTTTVAAGSNANLGNVVGLWLGQIQAATGTAGTTAVNMTPNTGQVVINSPGNGGTPAPVGLAQGGTTTGAVGTNSTIGPNYFAFWLGQTQTALGNLGASVLNLNTSSTNTGQVVVNAPGNGGAQAPVTIAQQNNPIVSFATPLSGDASIHLSAAAAAPSTTNYSMLSDGNLMLNTPASAGTIYFRTANSNNKYLDSGGKWHHIGNAINSSGNVTQTVTCNANLGKVTVPSGDNYVQVTNAIANTNDVVRAWVITPGWGYYVQSSYVSSNGTIIIYLNTTAPSGGINVCFELIAFGY